MRDPEFGVFAFNVHVKRTRSTSQARAGVYHKGLVAQHEERIAAITDEALVEGGQCQA